MEWPPLALINARHLMCMLEIRLSICFWSIVFQISKRHLNRCYLSWFKIFLPVNSHRCSIRFRYEYCTGHSKTSTFRCSRKIWITLALCGQALSCISWKFRLILEEYESSESWRMVSWYDTAFKILWYNEINSCTTTLLFHLGNCRLIGLQQDVLRYLEFSTYHACIVVHLLIKLQLKCDFLMLAIG